MPRTRLYREGELVAEGFPVSEVSDHLRDPAATVWLDLRAPTPDELAAVGEELGLHPLAVEGSLDEHLRPRLTRYRSHLFLTMSAVRSDPAGGLSMVPAAGFVTRNALVTVRTSDQFDIDAVVARWDAAPELAEHGVAFLLYGLLDYLAETHDAATELLDDQLESVEDELFADRPPDVEMQRRTYRLRKSLITLRRVVLPMTDLVDSLRQREARRVDEAMVPYYQDVYDQVVRTGERTDALRELVTAILETQLTMRGNRLNVIMKKVTSWAAIIAVPTAITGFYGQNLPYPGSGQTWGFWVSTAVIVALSIGLYATFRRNEWV